MSRLDAEHDPAEWHDLDRIQAREHVSAGDWPWHAYCGCGWSNPSGARTRGEARRWHENHVEDRLGRGVP